MAQGMQVFDGGGATVWDTDMFMGRYLGAAAIGTGTGTIVNDQFTTGIPWCIAVMESSTPINVNQGTVGMVDTSLFLGCPSFNFSGNQLIWNRSANYPSTWTLPSCTLYFGVR